LKLRPASLLRLPSGSAALFLNEARTQQLLVQEINTLYDSWGYLPVHTPLVDFSRAYEGLVPESDLKRVYHLVDRDGEILMLRWDITLFLIKQVRSLLQDAALPLRLCYSDSILRHQEAEDISRNEFFQSGAELIGLEGPEGDLEILLLLHAAMKKLGISPSVHLGSRQIFESAFASFDAAARDSMATAIVNRDSQAKKEVWAEYGANPHSDAIDTLFSLIADPSDARAALKDLLPKLPMNVALEAGKLVDFAIRVGTLEKDFSLRVDFSELGSQHYHSGIVFQAYVDGIDTHIAAGGRYDNLLARLGSPAPAVGFSIMLSKLNRLAAQKAPGNAELLTLSEKGASHRDFESRYVEASKLRVSGKRVSL
jgi:ATP phosphoribosyltransferase regulatory subunit